MINKILLYLTKDIWNVKLKNMPKPQALFTVILRILVASIRGFIKHDCYLRASALTFYTLLSIVPVAAMFFGIAKGFHLDKLLEEKLRAAFIEQPEVIDRIITYSGALLDNTKGGMVAGIGVVMLFWTVIRLLSNIEKSFNDIWSVRHSRSFGRKFSDYLSIMLICPVLIIMASSATVFIASQLSYLSSHLAFAGFLNYSFFILIKLLPYCVVWLAFTFIYMFIPNTRVKLSSALIAGVCAGTLYQLLQVGYIIFQMSVSKYNAIYGSFAALPLFLIWLQLSWLIVLFGAEIAASWQNHVSMEMLPDTPELSPSFKKLVMLSICRTSIKRFAAAEQPFTQDEFSKELGIPLKICSDLITELIAAGVLIETIRHKDKRHAFVPASDIAALSMEEIIARVEMCGFYDISAATVGGNAKLADTLTQFEKKLRESESNILLKDS